MYEIREDRHKRLVIMKISGLWTIDIAESCVADYKGAVDRLGCAPGTHLLLPDGLDAPPGHRMS